MGNKCPTIHFDSSKLNDRDSPKTTYGYSVVVRISPHSLILRGQSFKFKYFSIWWIPRCFKRSLWVKPWWVTFNLHLHSQETDEWIELNVSGIKPSARFDHSAVVYQEFMLIFGGEDSYGNKLNDLHAFSLGTLIGWLLFTK